MDVDDDGEEHLVEVEDLQEETKPFSQASTFDRSHVYESGIQASKEDS